MQHISFMADEIRQLAEKTRSETESIAQILDELFKNAEENRIGGDKK